MSKRKGQEPPVWSWDDVGSLTPAERAAQSADRGGDRRHHDRSLSPDEHDALLFRARRPAVLLLKTSSADQTGAPGCWLGGEPTLPPNVEWPCISQERIGGNCDGDLPLRFLAQLNVAQVPMIPSVPEMPRRGTLFFFDDGETGEDSRVIYVADDVSSHPPRSMPPDPAGADLVRSMEHHDYVGFEVCARPKRPITFAFFNTYDSRLFSEAGYNFARAPRSAMDAELNEIAWTTKPPYLHGNTKDNWQSRHLEHHFLFGCPYDSQYGDEMVPVLHMEYDSDIHFFHGDGECLVFWISRENLQAGCFERAFARGGYGI